jgi:hypothetical protein
VDGRTRASSSLDALPTMVPNEKIAFSDEIYGGPSGAGDAAIGGSFNGWIFWLADTPVGSITLAALRDKFACGI